MGSYREKLCELRVKISLAIREGMKAGRHEVIRAAGLYDPFSCRNSHSESERKDEAKVVSVPVVIMYTGVGITQYRWMSPYEPKL